MERKRRVNFCTKCRKNTRYILQKKQITKEIKGSTYLFFITTAVCEECGEEMEIPGLLDRNAQEIDEQYRAAEGIVTIDDIEKLMKIYKIGKAPLSLALGFGEITITRYLAGQIPSKEYSDRIRRVLASPAYMKMLLQKNKEKIADSAYSKAMTAAEQLENLFSVSDKMLQVIAYIFNQLGEVTPLMLQKLLYFIQGIYFVLYGRPMFSEGCEAWVHGPVYPEVYRLFRDFKYNPTDDARFSVLENIQGSLADDERRVIDLVIHTFGLYGGKALEKITHNEEPWKDARQGYGENVPSSEPIAKERIKAYYELVHKKYSLNSEEGINHYIHSMLQTE